MGSFVTTPDPEEHKILEYVFHVALLVALCRSKKKMMHFVKCYNHNYSGNMVLLRKVSEKMKIDLTVFR
jgi:hypothetical protein